MNNEKTKVIPFNELPYEERNKIIYYLNEEKILTIKQVINMLDNYIGYYQKTKLKLWIQEIERTNKREYEVVEHEI